MSLTDLEVERKTAPIGIDVERPRFSWVIRSNGRGVEQRSYRLRVMKTAGAGSGQSLVWDSGVVRSAKSYDIEYTGPALQPATAYTWVVDVITNRGSARGSSSLRTGLFDEADWGASTWIGNARPPRDAAALTFDGASWIWTPEATRPVAPPEDRAFRTTHASPQGKTATSAEIAITADDSFKLWVNGRLIGATAGANNEWQGARLFETALAADRNVFAVRTTNGPGSPAGLVAKIRVHYADGSSAMLATGTDWKAAKVFPEDFWRPDFDDTGWSGAEQQAVFGSGPWGRNVRAPRSAPRPAPLLRREFTVSGNVRAATLFVAAGGYANVSVNGAPASADVLSPGFTDYDDTVQYVATDVTDRLKPGANALGMELGRGFYGMTGGNVWRWESPPWHDEPVVRARMRIEYADGRVEDVVTDDSWRIADGPTVFDDLYAGETYDARLAVPNFDVTGFDDAAWVRASEVAGPRGELVNQRQQPIRVTEELPAVAITEPVPDTYVVKFPRVLAGWVEFSVAGPRGTTIRAQYGEKLKADGRPDFSNNGNFQSGFQTDRFILAGTGARESWEARFSYKGFQYIEVTGWPGSEPPPLDAFTAKAVHTDAPTIGSFKSASEIMNRTHEAVVNTLRNNIHGIPTDTPMFEKNGWTGDAAVGAEMFMLNLDVHELFAKWMRDVHETRDAEGAPLVIAPSSGNWGSWGIAPPWHSAYVLIPAWLHQYGGDRRVLTEYYDGMKRYVDLEYNRSSNGIVLNAGLGDWVSPEASPAGGNAPEDIRVSATAYLYTMLTSMRDSAELLGRTADAKVFAARAAQVKEVFNATFLDREAGYYRGNASDRGYRQTHNVLALAFGLAPDEATAQRVADSIAADVEKRGDTLNTGVLGTKYLLPVLTEHGHADVAYRLATQTKYPSWGFKIENGATSMWEHWSLEARSRGHYFLGTVDDWFYRHVAGIRPSAKTGFKDVTISPEVTREMAWARASTQTPFGRVASAWRREGRALTLKVDIPVGSTATVHVPVGSIHAVTENGKPVTDAEGVRDVRRSGGKVLVTVGSGRYVFVADDQQELTGRVIEHVDALASSVSALSDVMGRGAAARLDWHLDGVREQAFAALRGLRRSVTMDEPAKKLAKAHSAMDGVATELRRANVSPDQRAALERQVAAVREALAVAITDYLDVRLGASLAEAQVRPGDVAKAVVTVANGRTSALQDVRAAVSGPDGTWAVSPEQTLISARMGPGATTERQFRLTVPGTQRPGEVRARAELRYTFAGARIVVGESFPVRVTSPLEVTSVRVTPATVRPGVQVEVTATVRNSGPAPVTGAVELGVPKDWTAPAPLTSVTVPARGERTVAFTLTVPRDAPQAQAEYTLPARFTRDGATLATGSAKLRVEIDPTPVPAQGYDQIDLGVAASEQAHGLTASPSSGTSPEAGLTRRYAGHGTAFSFFEFDMRVVRGEAFVLRVTETYDRAQTKRYKVYVDGKEVLLRTHNNPGAGTVTYEFVVPASFATSDSVRIKFENQDDPTYYDPSIADVWSLPLK